MSQSQPNARYAPLESTDTIYPDVSQSPATSGRLPTYTHEIPKPQGDHWQNILDPLLERDKEQCDGWKAEVQNLLIFAGLFSAIVTAFLVESYQTLQADPQETAVSILTHIAARLDTLNITQPSSTVSLPLTPLEISPFTPSTSSVRVNILWFTSLVLSLTVVLVGIVCLQWLREHQAYAGASSSPREIYALFRMREHGSQRWRMPMFFASLPLLLELSVIIFFAGMVDFLWSIHRTVAVWVIAVISFPLIFLVITTTLPALQFLMLCRAGITFCQVNSSVPAPCPYKSPQSLLLCWFLSPTKKTFVYLSDFVAHVLYHTLIKWPLLLRRYYNDSLNSAMAHFSKCFPLYALLRLFQGLFNLCCILSNPLLVLVNGDYPVSYKDGEKISEVVSPLPYDCVRSQSWTASDLHFLRLRTLYDQVVFHRDVQYDSVSPLRDILHDVVGGLQTIVVQEMDPPLVLSAYHCFREVSETLADGSQDSEAAYYLGSLLESRWPTDSRSPRNFLSLREGRDLLKGVVHEMNTLFFFHRFETHSVIRTLPEISYHIAETRIRLTAHLASSSIPSACSSIYWFFILCVHVRVADFHKSPAIADLANSDLRDAYFESQVWLMESFLQLAFDDCSEELISPDRFQDFTLALSVQLGGVAGSMIPPSSTSPAFKRLVSLLAFISEKLIIDPSQRRDSFFWASSIFLDWVVYFYRDIDGAENVLGGQPVIASWATYRNAYFLPTWGNEQWKKDRPWLEGVYERDLRYLRALAGTVRTTQD